MSSEFGTVISLNGEAKCGKTTVAEMIAKQALHRGVVVPSYETMTAPVDMNSDVVANVPFAGLTTLSAGNAFRAATHYALQRRKSSKFGFDGFDTATDVEPIRELLKSDGFIAYLQSDSTIHSEVSTVAALPNAQFVCGALFCDDVRNAYFKDGRRQLVIVDARDPLHHFRDQDLLGTKATQIRPSNILPVYVDTPAQVAASRAPGDYAKELELIEFRRKTDRERREYPVTRPTLMIEELAVWGALQTPERSEVTPHYRFDNGHATTLSDIESFAGIMALAARDPQMIPPMQ